MKGELNMKKRIAYIGLSYPLFYDYQNQVPLSRNDQMDSPNSIIESPLGLMIFFDEIWFVCESICPYNMRELPYVKFVDQIFPDFYFEGAELQINNFECGNSINNFDFGLWRNKYELMDFGRLDNHTRGIQIGNIMRSGNCANIDNLVFDLNVVEGLRSIKSDVSIEFVSNSIYSYSDKFEADENYKYAEKMIITRIPNFLSIYGPYHESIDELRNSSYLQDYRKWIIADHENIKKKDIEELTAEVTNTIEEKKNNLFKKEIDNNIYRFSLSTSKLILGTVAEYFLPPAAIAGPIYEFAKGSFNFAKAKSNRWQGFILDADEIGKKYI